MIPFFELLLFHRDKKNNDISRVELKLIVWLKLKLQSWIEREGEKKEKEKGKTEKAGGPISELVGRARSIEDEIVMDSCGIGASPGG